jgi:Ca2+-binding EF-hand superfamily protein
MVFVKFGLSNDSNGDEQRRRGEVAMQMQQQRTMRKASINMLRGVFDTITNGSDSIDRGDLRKALAPGKPGGQMARSLLRVGDGSRTLDQIFAELDVDGDGKVTWDDVVRYMSGDTDEARAREAAQAVHFAAKQKSFDLAQMTARQRSTARREERVFGKTAARTFLRGGQRRVDEAKGAGGRAGEAGSAFEQEAAAEAEAEADQLRQAIDTMDIDAPFDVTARRTKAHKRAARLDGVYFIEARPQRAYKRGYYKTSNDLLLGKHVLEAMEEEDHRAADREALRLHALRRAGSKLVGSAGVGEGGEGGEGGRGEAAEISMAAVAVAAREAHSYGLDHALLRDAPKRHAVRFSKAESIEAINHGGGGGLGNFLVPTEYTRWARRQRGHNGNVSGTWLYADGHVHHATIEGDGGPGTVRRIPITREKAEAALRMQRVFRGNQSRKKAEAVWSDRVQCENRGMRVALQRGRRRDIRRVGAHTALWAQHMLGIT